MLRINIVLSILESSTINKCEFKYDKYERFDVLVVSCDKNIRLLDKFFEFYKRFAYRNEYRLYLSLEKGKYDYNGLDINIINYYRNGKFSSRLKDALKYINSRNVLLLLDDFIIEQNVNYDELLYLNSILNNSDDIASFTLSAIPFQNCRSVYYKNYNLRCRYARYKLCLQASLWNRDALFQLLNENESPWEVEIFGSIRTFNDHKKYFCLTDKNLSPIIYNDGFFVVQGKVNTIEKERLEKKFGVSFSIDGFIENKGVMIRDDISLLDRIVRRIRIIIYYIIYRYLRY